MNKAISGRMLPLASSATLRLLTGGLLALALGFPQVAFAQYILIDLGTLGGDQAQAESVNSLGEIVGQADTGGGSYHAFRWSDGVMVDLGTLGGAYGWAMDINDFGQVVGHAHVYSGDWHACIWEGGGITDLSPPSETYSCAYAINAVGQIVGYSYTEIPGRAFLWEDGTMTALGTFGGQESYVRDINDAGQAVGASQYADWSLHPFLWEDGVMIDLGTLGGDYAQAFAINELGQVAGASGLAEGGWHAFIWEDGVMTDIGHLGGNDTTTYDINNLGHVVGRSWYDASETMHAFLWKDGVMVDLNDTIAPGSGWELTEARSINDQGWIVGAARYSNYQRAFLLIPGGPLREVAYSFPLDADPGWNIDGTPGAWEFGQPTGGGSSPGDPNSGFTGLNVYGNNLDGDYAPNTDATLTTGPLDLTEYFDVQLRFRRVLGLEQEQDFGYIWVSNDGVSWTLVWDSTVDFYGTDWGWHRLTYDISDVADHQPSVQIRWGLTSDEQNQDFGWNIDDVEIIASRDRDGDGVVDNLDNCPDTPNPGQEDDDQDDLGNVCDNCPDTPNPGQEDGDLDAVGDVCDNCPNTYNPEQEDDNDDGVGDHCDCNRNGVRDDEDIAGGAPDSDSDGVLDECEAWGDLDGDGHVGLSDLSILLADYNCTSNCTADINGDGVVDLADLAELLAHYGL